MNLQEIRRRMPELQGLDDDTAVDVVHQLYYSDMDRSVVGQALGVKPAPAAKESSGLLRRTVGDTAVGIAQGVAAIPGVVTGLVNLAGGQNEYTDRIGDRSKAAQEAIGEAYSPELKAGQEALTRAKGLAESAYAVMEHPGLIPNAIAQSLPSMVVGAGAGGALAAGARALAKGSGPISRAVARMATPTVGGAAGEGIVAAGSAAEAIRTDESGAGAILTQEQRGIAAASGMLTGALGLVGAKVARSMGLGDIDTILAGGAGAQTTKSFTRRLLEGAVAEGVLEELPQSVQEQVAQNYALGKPLDEGVAQAAVLGTLAGAAMGGGTQVVNRPPAGPLQRATAAPAEAAAAVENEDARVAGRTVPATTAPVVLPAPTEAPATPVEALAARVADAQQEVPDVDPLVAGAPAEAAAVEPAGSPGVEPVVGAEPGREVVPGQPAAAPEVSGGEPLPVADASQPDAALTAAPAPAADPISLAANEAATSPLNDRPEPTPAQIEASNFKAGHTKVAGLDVTIQWPKGSTRKGTGPDGKEWAREMAAHYGHLKRTTGADGDNVDVYVGPAPDSERVYVIDQVKADGSFDEAKVMLGFKNGSAAQRAYKLHYPKGWKVGTVSEVSVDEFKAWLKDGDTTKPFGERDADSAASDEDAKLDLLAPLSNDALGRLAEASGGVNYGRGHTPRSKHMLQLREVKLAKLQALIKEDHDSDHVGASFSRRGEIALTGNELSDQEIPTAQLRRKAFAFAEREFVGKTFRNESNGQDIAITRAGVKHGLAAANAVEVKMLPALPDMLRKARYVESRPDRLGRPDVKAAHFYEARVKIGGEQLDVGIVVRELTDGHRYYDHFALKKGSPDGTSEAASGVSQKLGDQPASGEDQSVQPPVGLPLDQAEKLAAAFEQAGLKKVHVAKSAEDLPPGKRKELDGKDGVRGVYYPDTDEIWVVADQLQSAETLMFVAVHEGFHRGLRQTFGAAEIEPLLHMMYRGNASLRERADRIKNELGISRIEAIEEALADLAGEGQARNLKGWGKLITIIRAWLGKISRATKIPLKLSDEQLEVFVANVAGRGLKGDGPAQSSAPKMSRAVAAGSAADLPPQADRSTGWDIPAPSKLDDFLFKVQDKHIDTRRVLEAVASKIGSLREKWNPYLAEELYHGRAAKQTTDFLEKEVRPLMVEMSQRGVQLREFEEFLHARHAAERNAKIAEINPSMPDGGSGMRTDDAAAFLGGLQAEKRKVFDALARRIDAIVAGTRRHLVETGLESQDTVDAWTSSYAHYVPLQRAGMQSKRPGTGQGFSVRGSATKRAMGSEREVADILANVVMQRERAITRAEKNRVAQAVYGLAVKAPNKGFWLPVDPDANSGTPAAIKALQDELVSMGLDSTDAESVAREPRQRYVDSTNGLVAERVNPALRSRDNVLALRVDGKDRFVFFNERDERAARMAASLKNLDAPKLGELMSWSAKITRYFASINTQYNPVFGIINLMRDAQGSLLNLTSTPLAGKQAEVAKHMPSAVVGIMRDLRARRAGKEPTSEWAALFEEFEREGGRTAFRDMFATAEERGKALERELKKDGDPKAMQTIRYFGGLLSDYNDTLENATRLAAYKVARDNGMTPQRAASLAKNLTTNFNRKGQVTAQAGALYAFFNAAVQGTARLAETMKGPAGRRILVGGLALGAVQALLLAGAGFDDDEPPSFVRERSLIIPIGDGKYLSVPMPLGLHVIPNVSRIPVEWALSGFKDTGKRVASMVGVLADAFNPIGNAGFSLQTIAPTVIDPFAALAENKDFAGRPISRGDRSSTNPTPGHMRPKDTATIYARQVSMAINWMTGGTDYKPGAFSPTPDQIDYLIGEVTGGVGREVGKALQTGSSAVTGEDLPTHKIPLVGRLYGDTKDASSEASRFYDNLREINGHKAELKGRREKGEAVDAYIKENPESRLVVMAVAQERKVSALRKKKREMVEADADQADVKAVEERIADEMRRLNDRVKDLRALQ